LAISPNGEFIAFQPNGPRGNIIVQAVATGQQISKLALSNDTCYAISWSPDSRRIALAGADQTVRVYAIKTGILDREISSAARYAIDFFDRNHLLTLRYDGRRDVPAVIHDLQSGEIFRSLTPARSIRSLATNNSGLLVMGMPDGVVQMWNYQTGQLLKEFTGHSASVSSVAISGRGNAVASGSMDGLIYVWNVPKD